MIGPKVGTKAKPRKRERDEHYVRPLHLFRGVKGVSDEPDFRPIAVRPNPEAELFEIFRRLGKDYGGEVSPLDVLRWRLALGVAPEETGPSLQNG
jgi:hypothetical protein